MPIDTDQPHGQTTVPLPESISADQPHWAHLLPAGTFTPRDHRGPWTVEDAAAVVANSEKAARGVPLVIDYDHQSEKADAKRGPVPAAGWITRMEARSNGIWGQVEWTRQAADLINAKQYRFLSPVFLIEKGTNKVMSILRAGLTNTPALVLTVLANKENNPMPETTEQLLAELREALGLSPEMDAKDIIAAIAKLKHGKDAPSLEQYVPVETLRAVTAELNRLRQGVARDQASTIVTTAIQSGKMPPALRDWAVELCEVNKPAFDDFISTTGGSFAYLRTEILPDHAPNEQGAGGSRHAAIARQIGLSGEDMATYGKVRK